MAKAFSRLGTKLGGVLRRAERTTHDKKISDGIERFENTQKQIEKIANDIKETVPTVSGLSGHEKLSQVLEQSASLYGGMTRASKSFCLLAEALNKVGQEERQMVKTLGKNCYSNFQTFLTQTMLQFKKEKKALDDKTVDMDGARNKNQKSPSNEAALKANATLMAYHQQKRTIEGMIDDIPKHDTSQAASIKAYTEAMIIYHTKCAELFSETGKTM